ncbi:MAG TPA: methenyltetrahydromethanopterin cyclohydrolase [Rubellimicrobium sp.]|nr:methenyltetrahydromethanopterin cyclohydrolase [Rubellimicrobium sp.]
MTSRPDLPRFSLNARAGALADALVPEATALRIGVSRGLGGETLIDMGHEALGSLDAGLRLARISMAALAEVSLTSTGTSPLPWSVLVRTSQPWLACLGSQYAGWHLPGRDKTRLMVSGPARALVRQEPLFDDLPHREAAPRAVLVLEGDSPPDDATIVAAAEACRLPREVLTLLHAPTGSLAGMVQIAARVIECAVQKARLLDFPLGHLADAIGTAPVCPPHPDTRTAMGRANDAIIYGGRVQLFVTGPSREARDLAHRLPSQTCPDWGRGFSEVWDAADGDFARIDSHFFSPAEVLVTALETGETFRAGGPDPTKLLGATETQSD